MIVFYLLILYLRTISSPENFLSFIGMDQDPASYFQNGLEMTVLFLNFVIVFQSNVNLVFYESLHNLFDKHCDKGSIFMPTLHHKLFYKSWVIINN